MAYRRGGKKRGKKTLDKILLENINTLTIEEISDITGEKKEILQKRYNTLVKCRNDPFKWDDMELRFIIDNYSTKEYKEIGDILGRSENSVRNAVYNMGLNIKRDDYWTEAEIEYLKDVYEKSDNIRSLDYENLAIKMGKLKSNICRKARILGLTNRKRILTTDQVLAIKVRAKEFIKKNGHPRGMLGKHHSEENKKMWRELFKGRKMPFTPEQIEGYRERARKNISKLLAGEKMYSRAKRGRRSDLGNIFFRSSWEANYARVLNIEGKKWLYEPEQFVVKDVDSGVSIIYVPDFFLVDEKIYVEVKGWLDNDSKRKIKYFKNTFPDKKLLMVIDAKNKKVVSWLKDNNIDYIDYNELKKKYIEVLVEWEK